MILGHPGAKFLAVLRRVGKMEAFYTPKEVAGLKLERRFLSPEQVAGLIGVPVSTLAQWRYRGRGIPFLRIERLVRYDLADVEAYLQRSRVEVRGPLTGKRGDDGCLS